MLSINIPYCSGSHRFSSNILLDVDPRQAVLDIVKSKLLDNLEGDIPRALSPILELWQVNLKLFPILELWHVTLNF